MTRLLGRKIDDGNGEYEWCKGVKMESRGKLSNDGIIKYVGPTKNVRWREKACGSRDIWKLRFSIPTMCMDKKT